MRRETGDHRGSVLLIMNEPDDLWDATASVRLTGDKRADIIPYPIDAAVRHELEPWRRSMVKHAGKNRFGCAIEHGKSPMSSITNVTEKTQCTQLWAAILESIDHSESLVLWAEALAAKNEAYAGNGMWLFDRLLERLPATIGDEESAKLARDELAQAKRMKLPLLGSPAIVSEFMGHILEKSAACGDDAAARVGYDDLPVILRDAVPSPLPSEAAPAVAAQVALAHAPCRHRFSCCSAADTCHRPSWRAPLAGREGLHGRSGRIRTWGLPSLTNQLLSRTGSWRLRTGSCPWLP